MSVKNETKNRRGFLRNNLFHISGTDIVRCLAFRFQAFGRPVSNPKKFEEGIFSDLRNLKAGTDASLEEPKSQFLDFLYKNNCIRTQKKQKVFFWYSVPHDRLFLDALERDLKREKTGQPATTRAVSEPALSFEFDSSQSLFEQLTKAQQTNTSSFQGSNVASYSQSASPVMRAMDSMPPPAMMPQSMVPHSMAQTMSQTMSHSMPLSMPPMPQSMLPMHENPMPSLGHMQQYGQMSMAPNMSGTVVKSREQTFEPQVQQVQQFDRNGIPVAHVRHSSMPPFYEYSPAPSFASSHYEDYSNRGISFEPITPPQHQNGMGAEPTLIPNDDTGLFSMMPPDVGNSANFNPLMSMQPSNMMGPSYASLTRPFQPGNVYSSVIEGSPTYKQRRRRSNSISALGISAAVAATGGAAHQVHRTSDLRRSMSSSIMPVPEGDESAHNSPDSANGTNTFNQTTVEPKNVVGVSRHGTPLQAVEEITTQQQMEQGPEDFYNNLMHGDQFLDFGPIHNPVPRTAGSGVGPFRRARSATEGAVPYPQKTHTCPIPTCGRIFKRLEHLKR